VLVLPWLFESQSSWNLKRKVPIAAPEILVGWLVFGYYVIPWFGLMVLMFSRCGFLGVCVVFVILRVVSPLECVFGVRDSSW
jgi:hypothetical protein